MGSTSPVNPVAGESPGRGPGDSSARPGALSAGAALTAAAGAFLRAPVTARARRDLLFCAAEVPLGFAVVAFPLAVIGVLLAVGLLAHGIGPSTPGSRAQPAGVLLVVLCGIVVLLALVIILPRAARGLGVIHRRLAVSVLGEQVAPPPPVRPARGAWRRLNATLRDGPG